MIGLTVAEIRRRLPDIERFAAIGEFIDQPVKLYSSGMFVRLAFAAAIHVDPDILLVDEALAVGDAVFQHQCLLRIREMQASGTTIVFVSHEMGMIKAVCSRVVLLDAGQILEEGGPAEITSLYFARASAQIAKTQAPHDPVTISTSPAEPTFAADPGFDAQVRVFRHGTGAAKIRRIELLDSCGRPATAVANDEAVLRVHAEFLADVPSSIIGFGFRDRAGIELIGTNTFEEGITLPPRWQGRRSSSTSACACRSSRGPTASAAPSPRTAIRGRTTTGSTTR